MTDLQGKTIGEYQLIELFIDTPTTVILKSFQPSQNRYVALEVLKPAATQDATVSQRFLQFGEIAAQLQHPNLMPVYDAGREGGVVYRAMPWMPGGRLADHLSDYRDPGRAAQLFTHIEAALSYLHGQGYIHGHLTPENIYFDENQNIVLSGYGFHSLPGETVTAFQSPEQVQGGIIDKRSDIYACGVLLYTLLSGQTPPPGVVVSLQAVRPDLSPKLEMLILKAMAQNPDQRYQTAKEFSSALGASLQQPLPPQQPTQEPSTPTYASPAPPPAQKGTNWLAIILGILLIAILCLGAIFIVPQVIEALSEPADVVEPTQPLPTEPPPAATEIVPTEEPRPTRPPIDRPTEPSVPEEPTPLPEQTQEQLPELTNQPPGEGGAELPGICNSTGFIGGAAIFGIVAVTRKRKKGFH